MSEEPEEYVRPKRFERGQEPGISKPLIITLVLSCLLLFGGLIIYLFIL